MDFSTPPRIEPGRLRDALLDRTHKAIAAGVLHSIETEQRFIEDAGIRFMVRSVSSLRRKAQDRQERKEQKDRTAGGFNPFLPPEPELTVGAVTDTHLAVLNKFNVLDRHLLIVTRHFEHQETLLTLADLQASWLCLREIDGLGFYNGGTEAGASQTHKHLQLVPLPLAQNGPPTPMEPLFPFTSDRAVLTRIRRLPFRHSFCRLPDNLWLDPDKAAALTLRLYKDMLAQCGISAYGHTHGLYQSGPYNLLIRRGWMLLVPRAGEHYQGISINSLGYVGSLFVRSSEELQLVEETGPMRMLAGVSIPYPS